MAVMKNTLLTTTTRFRNKNAMAMKHGHERLHPRLAQGFTLVEILISLGIFLLIFTVMLQNFFLLQHTMQNIERERTMTMFVSSALQTLASDIDEYRIDIDASAREASSLVLVSANPADSTRIVYTFGTNAEGKSALIRKTASGDTQTYVHNDFTIKDGFFIVRPLKAAGRDLCKTHPSVTIGMTVEYNKPTPTSPELILPLQTTFSSPETAYSYLSNCNP